MKKQTITLSGFGDFQDNEEGLKDLVLCARKHKIEFYPTYYDHELKGDRDTIEKITMELWGMPQTQWSENALYEDTHK